MSLLWLLLQLLLLDKDQILLQHIEYCNRILILLYCICVYVHLGCHGPPSSLRAVYLYSWEELDVVAIVKQHLVLTSCSFTPTDNYERLVAAILKGQFIVEFSLIEWYSSVSAGKETFTYKE